MKYQAINLFEYQNFKLLSDLNGFNRTEFLYFLDKIWQEREKILYYQNLPKEDKQESDSNFDEKIASYQQFISEFRDTTIKARNYIGIIHFQGITFNLLPKIFYNSDAEDVNLELIQQNILWWLSYSKRLKAPKLQSNYNKIKTESFFEILIYLFASYTRDLLTRQIYQNYTEVDRELSYLKGRINMNAYIKDNLCTGNWAKISCMYDSFEIDNHLNRIIKSVCKMLLQYTKSSKQKLQEIIFTLDEVADIQTTAADCEKVKINPLFAEMQTVLDYCKLFLTNSMVYTWKNELKVFAFLLPMEKVFEEFVFGFMEKHREEIFGEENYTIKSQASDGKYLDNQKSYRLIHDILIKDSGSIKYIIDTKYKLAYVQDFKPSQSDMYQMVSYAIRQKCNHVKLFYPQNFGQKELILQKYTVKDELSVNGKEIIHIHVHQIPIISEVNNEKMDEEKLIIALRGCFPYPKESE